MSTEPRQTMPPLPVVRIGEIAVDDTAPKWLIRDLWSSAAVGLVGGTPKSYKSWIGLDMAVSVASGTPCLGRYPVETPGRVLIYLAEDALSSVRERVGGIAASRALDLPTLDVLAITVPRLRLDQDRDRAMLLETARRLRPRLVLLDPLVRLHAANENDAGEIAQLLGFLRLMQRELDLAVVLVHHTRKYVPAGTQAGQGLRGSGELHAFGDSNLYLRRTREKLILSSEHRSAPAGAPVGLYLDASDERAVHLAISPVSPEDNGRDGAALRDRVVALLQRHGAAMNRGQLRDALGVKNERLGHVLAQLAHESKIVRDSSGWRLSS